ncbi:MAG TPA: sigma-70 family RNA polymerase sigma factor [Candidatus Limnocylindrales bacterium]|nr:sigma-70 family RNA polymerase sigma factor [Candidatus Limnocylindrales bacterium]
MRPVVAVIEGGRAPSEPRERHPVPDDAGRANSIVEIYQAEHLGLFRFIRAATADDGLAEDVLQETFLRLVREVGASRVPANVHAWLFRVASNIVVSSARRARTAERHLGDLARGDLVASPEQYVLEAERDDAVRHALQALPLDSRLAILLAAQGFTGHEIAITLGRTDGAVRTLLCRARLRVRQRLEPFARSEEAAG